MPHLEVTEILEQNYLDLKMKPDFKYKAIYCGKDGHIFLETFCKYYTEISHFWIAIGEPWHRTKNIHEFILTTYSLYAAASMNIKTNDIITILNNLSKNDIPIELIDLIKSSTEVYGKVKLVLENTRYFIQCNNTEILMKVKNIPDISRAYQSIISKRKQPGWLNKKNNINISSNNLIISVPIPSINSPEENGMMYNGDDLNNWNWSGNGYKWVTKEEKKELERIDNIPSNGDDYFEIDPESIEKVKEKCIENSFPLLEEYDFKNDHTLPTMDINPKFKSPARGYQENALGIMFSNERARSGIIVLPCGAGKTLVGIWATCTVKKNTIILCNSAVSVEQWFREVKNWAIVKPEMNVARWTSRQKDPIWDMQKSGGIWIVSYTMMAFSGKRNPETEIIVDKIRNCEWGWMILDEVQVLPANMFRKIWSIIKSHCKLGLTATLVREDDKIKDLYFLIGPKHYEANWWDWQRDGYWARVKCVEIWCEMAVDFYTEYLKSDSAKRKKLYVANPNKFNICKALINKHKNDKIIIFSDDLFTLNSYAEEWDYPLISGKVPENERNRRLEQFRNEDSGMNCILMSKVGDTSLDLPNAKVIIQISSHFGSRRQEAQRWGRILRPKKDLISEYNAFFYTIITKNTEEMYFSNKRHRFLVDQGYYFKVVTDLKKEWGINEVPSSPGYNARLLSILKSYSIENREWLEEEDVVGNDFIDYDIRKEAAIGYE